jgi:LysM repeat protein
MSNRSFRIGTVLLVTILLVGGLASCQREPPARESAPTRAEDLGQPSGSGPNTPAPGETVISAVTSTPASGAALTPRSAGPTLAVASETPSSGATEPLSTPIPPGEGYEVYTVKPGDTLSSIATQFGTTVSELVSANNIADPSAISPGQELKVPTAGGATAQPTQPAQPPQPTQPVKPGDWIYQIARTCDVAAGDIISANRSKLPNPSVIPPGLVLCIP